jgi:hypothetical protein
VQHKICVVSDVDALYWHPYDSPCKEQEGPFIILHPVTVFVHIGSKFDCINAQDTTLSDPHVESAIYRVDIHERYALFIRIAKRIHRNISTREE